MIILSALGTGQYREAHYRSEHHDEVVTTGYFAMVLHRWYPEATVKILATQTAKASPNGQYLQAHYPHFEIIDIPEGKTEAEAWALFETLADPAVLPDGARVIFDITHGLRSLPMLGFLALSYLRVVRNITIERVYYGALELTPREGEKPLTPVLDLTPLVNLLDWAQAAKRFQDTGDARDITQLLANDPDLASFCKPLEAVSSSLVLQRPTESGLNALEFHKELQKLRSRDVRQKQLMLVLEKLDERFSEMSFGRSSLEVQPEQVLRGQYAQIRFYVRAGQFAQAVGLLYEWLRSVYFWKSGVLSGNRIWLGNYRKNKRIPRQENLAGDEWVGFHTLNKKVEELRHSFAHFNEFGASLDDAFSLHSDIRRDVTDLVASLPAAVRPLGLELEPHAQGNAP